MFIRFVNWIHGYVRVEVTGEKKERFVNLVRTRNISIWKIENEKDGYSFFIYAKDFKLLKDIVRKTGMKARIKERYGLPFFLFKYRKRKAFFLGIITAYIIVYIMSLFIWDISVDGNYSYTKYEIIDFLKENNVVHGMKKENVDCDAIEKMVRNHYFDVTWVSVELKGTRLIVHIRENFDDTGIKQGDGTEQPNQNNSDYNNAGNNNGESNNGNNKGYMLVSDRDAVIESIVTRKGKPMVKAGDAVTAGTVLIDGKFDITGDYDEYIRTEYVTADGDIYGRVSYPYSETIEREYVQRIYTGNEKTFKKLRINNSEADLTIGGTGYELCDRVEDERQLSLVGDFYIPVYISTVTYREYYTETKQYTDEQLKVMSEEKISVFLENLSKKGIQIQQNNVTIDIGTDWAAAKGDIIAIERLGRLEEVPTNIEETKGNNE